MSIFLNYFNTFLMKFFVNESDGKIISLKIHLSSLVGFGIIMGIYYSKEKYFKHESDDFQKGLDPKLLSHISNTKWEDYWNENYMYWRNTKVSTFITICSSFKLFFSSFEYSSFYFNIIFMEFSACFNINSIYLIPVNFKGGFFKSYITKSLIGT